MERVKVLADVWQMCDYQEDKKHINTCMYDLYGKLSIEIIKIQSKSHRKFKRDVSGPNEWLHSGVRSEMVTFTAEK